MENKNYTLKEYFENIKEELRTIRKDRILLKGASKNFRFKRSPVLFLGYLIKYKSISKIKDQRKCIDSQDSMLKGKYDPLRKEYKKRFDYLGYHELISEYEKKSLRIFDLERRKEDLDSIKKDLCYFQFKKKKKLKRVMYEFENPEGEFARRDRDIAEIVEKMEERGILLENIYLNKISEPEKNNKKK